jgi:single-strand DNA-binding protein
MARSINKAILLGNLTRDPVLRYTQSGKPVCDFGVATNRSWTNDKGERQELPEFHNIVAWGKLAEIASQYLTKGRRSTLKGASKPEATTPQTVRSDPAPRSSSMRW